MIDVGFTLTCGSAAAEIRICPTGVLDAGADGRGGGGGGVTAGAGLGGAAACGGGGGAAAFGAAAGGGGAGADSGFAADLPLTAPGLSLNNCCPALTVSPSCT